MYGRHSNVSKQKKKKNWDNFIEFYVKSLRPHANEIPILSSYCWKIKREHAIYVQSYYITYSFIVYNIKY